MRRPALSAVTGLFALHNSPVTTHHQAAALTHPPTPPPGMVVYSCWLGQCFNTMCLYASCVHVLFCPIVHH